MCKNTFKLSKNGVGALTSPAGGETQKKLMKADLEKKSFFVKHVKSKVVSVEQSATYSGSNPSDQVPVACSSSLGDLSSTFPEKSKYTQPTLDANVLNVDRLKAEVV